MTERIKRIYERLNAREYRNLRTCEQLPLAKEFAQEGLSLARRSGKRLLRLVQEERAVLFPEDEIGFYRTIANVPSLLTEAEAKERAEKYFVFDFGGVMNISSNYADTIARGLDAKRTDILASMKAFVPDSPEYEELTAMLDCIDAALLLAQKYRTQAEKEGCTLLAKALARVPHEGATTYYEALVFLRLLNFLLWLNGNKHNTLGRFDVYMYPYFAADLAAGRLTRERAVELTEEFFLSLNFDADLYPGIQQGDNGQSLMLGGVDKEGREVFNELSRICLESSLELKLIDPKINVRVNQNTPDEVYRLGTQLTKQGLGFPQYSNDDIVIPALVSLGYDKEDARDYTVAACWEFIIPGKGMDIPNIDALSFPAAIDRALRGMGATDCFEDLLARADEEIVKETNRIAESVKNLVMEPSPFQSILMDGCIERGTDIAAGGKYNNYGIHGAGLANAADALASVQKNVFIEKNFSLATLIAALDANFEGYERERSLMLTAPKMGNYDDCVDELGVHLLDTFSRACANLVNERGGRYRAGTGTAMYYIWLSRELGATADGRKSGQPFAANYSPALDVRTAGVLSVIQSFTKPDLKKTCNGGPLTLEFHDTVFRNEEGINKVAALVKTYIALGGHQLQLNAVNRERLLDAKRNPEAHKNLIVRVWGWSGYFNELDEEYQNHVIKRLEYIR